MFSGQSEDVIEFLLVFVEHSDSEHSVDQSFSFENSLRVGFVKGEEISGSLSDSSQDVLHSPDFSLVFQSVLTDEQQSRLIKAYSESRRSFSKGLLGL